MRFALVNGRTPRPQPLIPASKPVALTPSTEAPEPKDREVLLLPTSLLWRWDARSAGDHSTQRSSGGSDRLAARERDVLVMISQGCSNKRIARSLEISPETVKSYVKRTFSQAATGAGERVGAAPAPRRCVGLRRLSRCDVRNPRFAGRGTPAACPASSTQRFVASLAYRLHSPTASKVVTWKALHAQFGRGAYCRGSGLGNIVVWSRAMSRRGAARPSAKLCRRAAGSLKRACRVQAE